MTPVLDRPRRSLDQPKSRDQEAPLSADELRRLLIYKGATGRFFRPDGTPASRTPSGVGYLRIRLHGRHYYQHRLAWLYVNGEWPQGVIDHINGDKTDNRIVNLRDASKSQNGHNSRPRTQASGYPGVYWHPRTSNWQAKIESHGRSKSLGYFDDPAVAGAVYRAASRELAGLER